MTGPRVLPLALAVALATAVLGGGLAAISAPQQEEAEPFPHLDHQGLFPLCTGCHQGVPEGDSARYFPGEDSCVRCHDGVEEERVEWEVPAPRTDLLAFDHQTHATEVLDEVEEALECASYHVDEAGPRLAVVDLAPGRCLTCHDEDPDDHLSAASDCASCHRPLAEAATGEERLATLSTPADHEAGDFLLTHDPETDAGLGRCVTCHVQERCTSCHVDSALEPIPAMPAAPVLWRLPEMTAEYPIPAEHETGDFEATHGRPAPVAADCSTCHTQDDCSACHLAPLPPSAESLPSRAEPDVPARAQVGGGPGVGLEARLPGSHESPFFMEGHAAVAAAQGPSCSSCHSESYCADCHDSARAPGYHPSDFALRHAAAAGSASMECANCHNVQAFCRQCHVESGLGSVGRLGAGYHDAEPLWLLRHGQGARQGLEQCASCHTQRECLQCHSETGAFKVSPHGPDFDAERARERNPWICSACHLGLGGDA